MCHTRTSQKNIYLPGLKDWKVLYLISEKTPKFSSYTQEIQLEFARITLKKKTSCLVRNNNLVARKRSLDKRRGVENVKYYFLLRCLWHQRLHCNDPSVNES